MEVTIIREIFLFDIELDVSECPTQEEVNSAVEKVLDEYENNDPYRQYWSNVDILGNPRIKVYDDYSGIKIYDSIEK